MTQLEVAANRCTANVEVAVAHTKVIATVALSSIVNGGTSLGVQYIYSGGDNLDIAGRS